MIPESVKGRVADAVLLVFFCSAMVVLAAIAVALVASGAALMFNAFFFDAFTVGAIAEHLMVFLGGALLTGAGLALVLYMGDGFR